MSLSWVGQRSLVLVKGELCFPSSSSPPAPSLLPLPPFFPLLYSLPHSSLPPPFFTPSFPPLLPSPLHLSLPASSSLWFPSPLPSPIFFYPLHLFPPPLLYSLLPSQPSSPPSLLLSFPSVHTFLPPTLARYFSLSPLLASEVVWLPSLPSLGKQIKLPLVVKGGESGRPAMAGGKRKRRELPPQW